MIVRRRTISVLLLQPTSKIMHRRLLPHKTEHTNIARAIVHFLVWVSNVVAGHHGVTKLSTQILHGMYATTCHTEFVVDILPEIHVSESEKVSMDGPPFYWTLLRHVSTASYPLLHPAGARIDARTTCTLQVFACLCYLTSELFTRRRWNSL